MIPRSIAQSYRPFWPPRTIMAGLPALSWLPDLQFGPAAFGLMGRVKTGRFYLLNPAAMRHFRLARNDSQTIGS
jgi:hypothetical protein